MVRRILGTAWGLILLALAFWVATLIPHTVAVFITAAVIALGVHPVTKFLERYMRRGLSITIVYLVLLAATIVVALLVVPTAVGQTAVVVNNFPDQLASFEHWANGAQAGLDARFGKGSLPIGLTDIRAAISDRISTWGPTVLAGLAPALLATLTALFVAISAIILSIFFLASGEQIRKQILSVVPHAREHEMGEVLNEVVHIFGGFVAGQAILCAITGIAIWALLAILGFKFALLVGVFCGIAYAVPFVGMLVAQVVGAVLAAPQGWAMVWWVTIVIFVVARVADNVLVPKIMAPHVGVSPIAVMFGVFAGGELFGLPGLVLGIPAAAMAKVLWRIFVRPWLSRHDIGPRAGELKPGEREIDIDIHETIVERPRIAETP